MTYYLGIDTSAYTTSLALVDETGQIFSDERLILQVDQGKRGLRQSDALFLHIKNLPDLVERLELDVFRRIQGIAVSAWPRPVEGSYMPVFLAGVAAARTLAVTLGVPLFQVSHQEGHVRVGMAGNPDLKLENGLLAVHFSGGTSEILKVRPGKERCYDIEMTMAGSDIHAGQLVDRVGVALGLPFPAGREMEKLALQSDGERTVHLPASVGEQGFSFSGVETRAMQYIREGIPPSDIALATLRVIANTLEKALLRECQRYDIGQVLLVGGVMANSIIKKRLRSRLEHQAVGIKLFFAEPTLSSDNAVGVALLASDLERQKDCWG
ncbi:MAG: peptidase M22 [Syntrophomonas sp.]